MNITSDYRDLITKDNARFSRDRVTQVLLYVQDVNKKERQERGVCKCCYYLVIPNKTHISYRSLCGGCGETASTCNKNNTDILCPTCARELISCQCCGGEMD